MKYYDNPTALHISQHVYPLRFPTNSQDFIIPSPRQLKSPTSSRTPNPQSIHPSVNSSTFSPSAYKNFQFTPPRQRKETLFLDSSEISSRKKSERLARSRVGLFVESGWVTWDLGRSPSSRGGENLFCRSSRALSLSLVLLPFYLYLSLSLSLLHARGAFLAAFFSFVSRALCYAPDFVIFFLGWRGREKEWMKLGGGWELVGRWWWEVRWGEEFWGCVGCSRVRWSGLSCRWCFAEGF